MSLHGQNGKRFSNFRGVGEDSDDDDAEVLPSANSTIFNEATGQASSEGVWRDGQWFNALDEQYLLPVFSNATASRRQATRKAMRSTARLTQHGNDSFIEDNESERDLTAISREGLRSPWDASPGIDVRQGPASAPGSAAPGARDSAAPGGQGRNSRGFVNETSHQTTPSLSAAVSLLFSSVSPVSSSARQHDLAGEEADSAADGGDGGGTILPLSSSSARYTYADHHVQEIFVPDGSLSYTTSTPPMPSVSLASFRMPKRRTSDENVQQSVTSASVMRARGASSSSSPLKGSHEPKIQHESLRFTPNPATASIVREDTLQRRLSAPISRSGTIEGDDQHAERSNRSQSSAGHY